MELPRRMDKTGGSASGPGRRRTGGRLGRWIFVAVVVGATALFVRLGFWQLHRLAERKAENAARRARQALPPLAIPGGTAIDRLPLIGRPGTGRIPSDTLTWRSARLVGRFDRRREIVLRDRSYRGVPGVYVVTPLLVRESGDSVAVPVLRGWLPAADAFHAPLKAGWPDSAAADGRAAGPDSVRVLLLPAGSSPPGPIDTLDAPDGPHPVLGHLDAESLARLLPYPVARLYAQRVDARPSGIFPVRIAPPELSNGPHLSYALQWFAFAVISVVGGVIFWRRGGAG
jgi:surfeit locus 1 family protein